MFPAMLHSKINGCGSSSSVLASYVTGASHLLVPGRVTAVGNIAQGTLSSVIDPENLVGQPDVQQVGDIIFVLIYVHSSKLLITRCHNLKDVLYL